MSGTAKSPSASRIVLNTLMMPEHANHFGNVHGGIVTKLCDEAAAISAMRHAREPSVTVAIDSMTFQKPIRIGDLVTCTAWVSYVHKSSMEVTVLVHAENPITGERVHTNSAFLVFVALGKDGRPTEVPDLVLESDEERTAYAAGRLRQERRLATRPPR